MNLHPLPRNDWNLFKKQNLFGVSKSIQPAGFLTISSPAKRIRSDARSLLPQLVRGLSSR
jgi:hypothetical protein